MPPPANNPQSEFNRQLELASGNVAQFVTSLPQAAQGLTGLNESFRSLSRTVSLTGAGIARLVPALTPLGLGIAGVGLAGLLGSAALSGGMGLAGQANQNGLESVNKAFDILAGTIGGVLQPAFVMLGGLALMGADSLRGWIKEHRAEIIKFWTDGLEKSIQALSDFSDWLNRLSHWGENKKLDDFGLPPKGEPQARPFGPQFDPNGPGNAIPWLGQGMQPGGPLQAAPAPKGPLEQAGGFLNKWADKMEVIMRDMATAGGKPTLTDPVSKWKEVAMAISQSELENRKLAMQKENLDLLRDIIRAIRDIGKGGGAPGLPAWVVPGMAI